MLSKLAYEEQHENGVKDQDPSKKTSGNKKKKATMSLEEFNNMGASAAGPGAPLTANDCNSKQKGILIGVIVGLIFFFLFWK